MTASPAGSLPRTATGKILERELREQLGDQLDPT
jgi:acyl-coenzyme A synthetase/AMP-(fatty) acid ligase